MRRRINVELTDLSVLCDMLLFAGVDVPSGVTVLWPRGQARLMLRQMTILSGFRLSHRLYDPV